MFSDFAQADQVFADNGIQNRLKIHYVAMTRPSHLLCLAMTRALFENGEGGLDQNLINRVKSHGWRMKSI